jgi:2-hydroxychromene-2-carboxylate isomerase
MVMARTLDVYFDFGSMNSYFAHKVLPGIAERTGAELRVAPVLIGGLFKLVGNLPPLVAFKEVKGKVEYFHTETARFVRRHKLDRYRWNPHFPVNTLAAMRAATAADMDGMLGPFADAGFRAMWEDERPLAEPETLRAVIAEAGLDPDRIFARMQQQDVKDRLATNTSELAARGGFGLPSVFLGDELYYGKDSLRDLEDDLAETA